MHRKTVLFVTNDLEPDPICRHVLAELDVQVSVASLAGYRDSLSAVHPAKGPSSRLPLTKFSG